MNALLVLDKPQGLSSHSAVHRIRKITGEERVGHAGTLDPMATGVLLILLGSGVRLSEWIIEHDKKYRATVKLGVETDSYDATGSVVAAQSVNLSPEQIQNALSSFVGKQNQVPPAHSAIQIQGKRAYKLARKGEAVELAPRPIEIYSIDIRSISTDTVEFDVHCSKGTYIRSLAHDLGAKLGVGGHLAGLRRLAVSQFTLESSITLDQVTEFVTNGTLTAHLLPMDLAIPQFAALQLDAAGVRDVRNGRFIPAPQNLTTPLIRAYDEQHNLVAILERVSTQQLKPKKVL